MGSFLQGQKYDIPELFASAMMSLIVMLLRTEIIFGGFRLCNDADTGADNLGYTDADKLC